MTRQSKRSPCSIRLLTSAATFHGSAPGFADETGNAVRFSFPRAIATDADGILYVADPSNHVIHKMTSSGAVSTFAGSPGLTGAIDGAGPAARFDRGATKKVETRQGYLPEG